MTDHTTYQDKPWLAHYEQGVPENIVYEETCLPEFLETSAQKFPDKTALIFQGYTISYAKLNEMVNALAGCLTDGWFHTGDIAKMNEDGYFYIVDRKKNMIISGGYNVYPRDIDEVFYDHPKVQEACSIGIPHPTRGEAVKIFVVLKEGETAAKEDFISYCETRLAKYKLPTEIEFRTDLPKTNVGKILRKELRAEGMEKHKSDPIF